MNELFAATSEGLALFLYCFSGFFDLFPLLFFERHHDVELLIPELLEILIPRSFEVEDFLFVGFFN
jgi:hypothetical protein